ncbi:hypothetical protein COS91_06120 [Candidatus Desantisbacteria bacterium CG07_land_8_20_14_0_80_39_15]|uniref:Predicted DNA-binding protein ribbon-helix-helix domain-containing protein n=2 Tax=unclassified Candidatus Desantisiibacteriota TaxID=3106372 RepID=A0A2H9PAF1_9BACT|nr:MAG: hypothetical protein COS91_06120 [Candidatus Desantisbacteria bacterium CG07_land_8_20_14_0_80_39_15]PIZ15377.1 MAG: hypothetical protein COY51_05370 [Candidatus Desantisbacteria bacterium CG_4_10_14_0_8_um_filter_39_17]
MRSAMSISLPEKLFKKVKQEVEKENIPSSELVRKALNGYFFITEFRRLQQKALTEMEKRGLKITDEEIFRKVS